MASLSPPNQCTFFHHAGFENAADRDYVADGIGFDLAAQGAWEVGDFHFPSLTSEGNVMRYAASRRRLPWWNRHMVEKKLGVAAHWRRALHDDA